MQYQPKRFFHSPQILESCCNSQHRNGDDSELQHLKEILVMATINLNSKAEEALPALQPNLTRTWVIQVRLDCVTGERSGSSGARRELREAPEK